MEPSLKNKNHRMFQNVQGTKIHANKDDIAKRFEPYERIYHKFKCNKYYNEK